MNKSQIFKYCHENRYITLKPAKAKKIDRRTVCIFAYSSTRDSQTGMWASHALRVWLSRYAKTLVRKLKDNETRLQANIEETGGHMYWSFHGVKAQVFAYYGIFKTLKNFSYFEIFRRPDPSKARQFPISMFLSHACFSPQPSLPRVGGFDSVL